ncbi:MAG: hypothetical protein ACPLYF_02465 [Fervidobacterium sp.]
MGNLTLFIGKVLDAWTDENAQPLVFEEKDFFG